MKRFVEGADRGQGAPFYMMIGSTGINTVRVIGVFVDEFIGGLAPSRSNFLWRTVANKHLGKCADQGRNRR